MEDILNCKQKILYNPAENNRKSGTLFCRVTYKQSINMNTNTNTNSNTNINANSLLSYILGGMYLHLNIAVDFTCLVYSFLMFLRCFCVCKHIMLLLIIYSATTDHDHRGYTKIIEAFGNTLEPYLYEKGIGGFGFGSIKSDCFNLNLSNNNDKITGISNFVKIYKQCLNNHEIKSSNANSRNYHEIIDKINYLSSKMGKGTHEQNYNILVLITNGSIINNPKLLIKSLSKSINLPLSIIIVGIGYNINFNQIINLIQESNELNEKDFIQSMIIQNVNGNIINPITNSLKRLSQQIINYMASNINHDNLL